MMDELLDVDDLQEISRHIILHGQSRIFNQNFLDEIESEQILIRMTTKLEKFLYTIICL